MHRLVVAMLLVALAGCTAPRSAASRPNPFPDLVLADVNELGPDGTITELVAPHDIVVVADEDRGPMAFARKDPNIGCRLSLASDDAWTGVEWIVDDAAFVDPCRGEQYDRSGSPVRDAEAAPMAPLPTTVRDGVLVWDRSEQRARFEETAASGRADPGR